MKRTQQQAIHAYCKGCIYDPLAGGSWLDQVEACTMTDCELFEHRPLTYATRAKLREARFNLMNPDQQAKYRVKQEKARVSAAKNFFKEE